MTQEEKRPDEVTYAWRTWVALAVTKFISLVFSGAAALIPQSTAREAAREMVPEGIDPELYGRVAGVASVVMNICFGLLFAGLILFFAQRFVKRKKEASSARFTLLLFAGILIIDAMMGVAVAGQLGVPVWLTLAIGWAHILVLVSGVLAIYFSTRPETHQWANNTKKADR